MTRSLGSNVLKETATLLLGQLGCYASVGFLASQTEGILDGSASTPVIDWDLRAAIEMQARTSTAARSWLELARATDEYCIRNGQYVHFLKHAVLDDMLIRPADDFVPTSKWHFVVTLFVASDDLWHKAGDTTIQGSLEQDIVDEFACDQQTALSEPAGLPVRIQYQWSLPNAKIVPFAATPSG